ncbi:MAG: universal stress protein [Leptothrix sp. (in: b-proteobacteria)]
MFQHLLVPVDGSELSERAIDASIELAVKFGARITGLVVEPEVSLAAVAMANPATLARDVQNQDAESQAHANKVLGHFEERTRAAGVTFAGQMVASTSIDHAIVEAAKQADADLIVMVTHGRGVLGELVFGAHTKSVMSQTKVPLLVLH